MTSKNAQGVTDAALERLRELSAKASQNWNLKPHGVIVGGEFFECTNGTAQTQVAHFGVPRGDDLIDPSGIQLANTQLALECVNFVRALLASRQQGEGERIPAGRVHSVLGKNGAWEVVYDGGPLMPGTKLYVRSAPASPDAALAKDDPWRGLYSPEKATRDAEGLFWHPDLPTWEDDREESIKPLVHAQGFDIRAVEIEVDDEIAMEGGDAYWQALAAWQPEPQTDGWRLAAVGDTEDGPLAWFVRPRARIDSLIAEGKVS